MNNRVARCSMFVTPTNPRFIDKAWTRGGDVYILDIEDSIAPAEQKVAQELAQAEEALIAECTHYGIAWTVFRPTLIYGRGMDKNVAFIAHFIRRFGFFPLVGAGNGLRQPVHADDLATACVQALACERTFNRAYNLSGATPLTYRQMVQSIFAALGKPPRLIEVPLGLLGVLVAFSRLLPRYRHIQVAMFKRMNQDLCFDHQQARVDFGFAPRRFEPDL